MPSTPRRLIRPLLLAPALLAWMAGAVLDPPYFVLRPDGSSVRLMAPPVVKGDLLLGHLWPTGTLVSFPRGEIDLEATARVNRTGFVPPTPRPTPYPTLGPHQTPPLGDMVRMRVTRADAERAFRDLRKGTPGQEDVAAPAPTGPPPAIGSLSEEEYWRARARNLQQRQRDAGEELRIATEDREAWERQSIFGSKAQRETWARELQERRGRQEKAKATVDELREAEEGLREEARKAGALPGWLR